jgi:formylglycine-generating enzyme required for sulfatase activity
MDARNDPIQAEQPISSIDLDSARAYTQWRGERDGLSYRMIRPEENEKVVRGSLPLTYPWGYENDPNAVASRLAHSNMEDIFPLAVGTHPRGTEWYRDITRYGSRDHLGNIREFTVDDRLPTLAVMAGGSVRTPLGPYYLPPGRAYLHKGVAEDGSGSFRLVLDLEDPAAMVGSR